MTGEVGHVLDLMFTGNLVVNKVVNANNGSEVVRYAVVSASNEETPEDSDRFLLMFTVTDETGSLAKAVNAISDHGFNMRILRSRPMKDLPWHYYFYAEADGNISSENGQNMLKALDSVCKSVKVLGQYKAE